MCPDGNSAKCQLLTMEQISRVSHAITVFFMYETTFIPFRMTRRSDTYQAEKEGEEGNKSASRALGACHIKISLVSLTSVWSVL